jgi:hypothetical protein
MEQSRGVKMVLGRGGRVGVMVRWESRGTTGVSWKKLVRFRGGHEDFVMGSWIVQLSTRRQVANSVERTRCQNR